MIAQSDRCERMFNDFIHELALEDVESNLTVPYKPQQDDIPETSNRIIDNDANVMIKWASCPKFLWVPAMETTLYNLNCSKSNAISTVTPSKAIAVISTGCEVT